jgi:hypothetical protein
MTPSGESVTGGFDDTPVHRGSGDTPVHRGSFDDLGAAGDVGGPAVMMPPPVRPSGGRVGGKAKNATEDPNEAAMRHAKTLSLDQFLHLYTSEDNESFEELMVDYKRKLRQKNEWLYVIPRPVAFFLFFFASQMACAAYIFTACGASPPETFAIHINCH